MGSLRIRFPVAANTALATAGASGGTPGSPMPPGWTVGSVTVRGRKGGVSSARGTGTVGTGEAGTEEGRRRSLDLADRSQSL